MNSKSPAASSRAVWLGVLASLLYPAPTTAVLPNPDRLEMAAWTAEGMVMDPVAIAFDHLGRLYVVESARRSTVDIDIRSHQSWLLEDLASDDFESMRAFFRRRMASELSDENKGWLLDRNQDGVHDFHDLTTISERIRLVEDTDGDNQADKSTLFADGFQEEFTGVAAGVLPVGGDVFFTVYPDLWRLRDVDGDGHADERESMFRGFGVHAAFDGHDLHGLTMGPEGKIYFSCGDNGFSIRTREGQRLHYPNTGGVLRMKPDGSELEVFASGLRNVQEFDFDQYGNMFGVDNDGDLEDERERAVYIAEGSDSGWRVNWQFRAAGWSKYNGGMTYNPWVAEGMWKPRHPGQPAYITPPMQNYSVGPGGFKFNPGTALNPEYRDFFFCVQFPVQQITAFRTRPQGAGFEMVDEHVFHTGLMVSSLNFGPDGAIYLADWVGKWEPNQQGMIYRVDDPARDGSPLRRSVQRLINLGVAEQTTAELADLLGHDDRRVRQLAQFELVRRQRGNQLLEIATNRDAKQLARIHALWGLIQLGDPAQAASLGDQLPWTDTDSTIRQQCARVAGDLRLASSVPHLIELLRDTNAMVQSHAAIALGKLKAPQAADGLAAMLLRNGDADPFVRHAGVMGLAGCASGQQLAAMHIGYPSEIRLGAVLALRRQADPRIAVFLDDAEFNSEAELQVLRETVRAIHDDFSIPRALPALAAKLEQRQPPPFGSPDSRLPADEPILRRVISANLRVGDGDAARRIARFIVEPFPEMEPGLRESLQVEALQCLTVWDQTPLVDRVEGRIRKPTPDRDLTAGRRALQEHLLEILERAGSTVATEAIRAARQLQLPMETAIVARTVSSPASSPETRAEALRLLDAIDAPEVGAALESISADAPWPLRKVGLELLARRDNVRAWNQLTWDTATNAEQQFFVSLLPKLNLPQAKELLHHMVDEQLGSTTPSSLTLDVLDAARGSNDDSFARKLARWDERLSRDRWGAYAYAIAGGDASRGETIYRTHVAAQCVRCHQAGGQGKQAGPVLAGIASRVDRQYLLESLVEPSAKIAKGFDSITVVTTEGAVITGSVIEENAAQLRLGTPQGEQVVVETRDIDARKTSEVSAMPDMIPLLSPMQVRDLVEYLSTLRNE